MVNSKANFLTGCRLVAPHLAYLAGVHTFVFALDSPRADHVLNLALAWLCIGSFVVFAILHNRTPQLSDRVDWRGAAQALYRAAWWPWYVLGYVLGKGKA